MFQGFKLVASKLVRPTREHLESHYCDLSDKPFFPKLINYMSSGPVVAMVRVMTLVEPYHCLALMARPFIFVPLMKRLPTRPTELLL